MNRQQQHEPSELERAFNNYREMEAQHRAITAKNQELMVQNMNLVSEVSMLREMLERSDTDRIRLQAVSSTLLGRLLAINAVIGDAVKAANHHGIEAVMEARRDEELERAGEAAAAILDRVQPHEPPKTPISATPISDLRRAVTGPVSYPLRAG